MASVRSRPRKDGTTSWSVLWRENGKQTSAAFDTESEADLFARVLNANGQSFELAAETIERAKSTSPTVLKVIETHIDLLTEPSDDTIRGYRSILKNHIVEQLGGIPIDSVTVEDLTRWIRWMQDRKKSVKTISNAWGAVLAPAFDTAVRKGWRADNPCNFVKLPRDHKSTTRTIRPLTKTEFDRLHKAMTEQYKLFTRFLALTGLRFGEATALTWDDLDLEAEVGNVSVTKAWKGSYGFREVGTPKSRSGVRNVPLPRSLVVELKASREGAKGDDLVFTNRAGGPVTSGLYHHFGWKDAIEAKGVKLEGVRPHDLRHTYASWLLQSGMDAFKVSRLLGHASLATTLKVYGHLMPEVQREAAEAMESYAGGIPAIVTKVIDA